MIVEDVHIHCTVQYDTHGCIQTDTNRVDRREYIYVAIRFVSEVS
jgi:hypothetical protein